MISGLLKEIKESDVLSELKTFDTRYQENDTSDVYKKCLSFLDLTSLNITDNHARIEALTQKAVEMPEHYGVPSVAAICVSPLFIETVGVTLGNNETIGIASTVGGFPLSQTYLEVKMLECSMAVENGADEVDMVFDLGEFLTGNYEEVKSEIEIIKEEISGDALLKIIIESGEIKNPSFIRTASLLAMEAGADFVKSSTGKTPVSATPEAAVIMCHAIRDFYEATGMKKGIKLAGGITTAEQAVHYYTIVKEILGETWLTPELFRIGASRLANDLLSKVTGKPVVFF